MIMSVCQPVPRQCVYFQAQSGYSPRLTFLELREVGHGGESSSTRRKAVTHCTNTLLAIMCRVTKRPRIDQVCPVRVYCLLMSGNVTKIEVSRSACVVYFHHRKSSSRI